MKVAAHPLVVAVALGLLGPTALAEEERESARTDDCTTCKSAAHAEPADALASMSLLNGAAGLELSELASTAPTDGEWHQVEAAWLEAREGF